MTPALGLRPRDAAAAIGISERKLRELVADPKSGIPHVRIGKCVIYPVRELTDWLTRATVSTVSARAERPEENA